jgi:hypothetical protein
MTRPTQGYQKNVGRDLSKIETMRPTQGYQKNACLHKVFSEIGFLNCPAYAVSLFPGD